MGHSVDLKNLEIRTDLAIDHLSKGSIEGILSDVEKIGNVKVTNVVVEEQGSKVIHKKPGNYITIEFEDITDYDAKEQVKTIFCQKLKELLSKSGIQEHASCLVIGLGNEKSTPDALGPLTIHNILVTNHLYLIGDMDPDFRPVSAIAPGVMGQTGMETSEMIASIVKVSKADFVIAIDALASQSVERVNKTIQMTDTGIQPGSGVGNSRKEVSQEVLGIPVIAIGVPTVVDAVTIVSDTIQYMYQHFSYNKENRNNPLHKLVMNQVNYLKKEIPVNEEDKEKLLGMVGKLSHGEIKQLVFEVLTPIGYNLMVTPKEVDFLMEKLSDVIGNGLNQALHKKVDNL